MLMVALSIQEDEEKILDILPLFVDKVDDLMEKNNEGKTVFDYTDGIQKFPKVKTYLRREMMSRRNKDNPSYQEKLKRREEERNKRRRSQD